MMGHVLVVNNSRTRRLGGRGFNEFYIGRPSAMGNPYRIGPDGTRAQVITKYRAWLVERLARRDEPGVVLVMDRIVAKLRAGEDVTLVCWCAPLPCHGDVIASEAVRLAGQSKGVS